MMNQTIPTGMTEKEYFEVHASQAEFLDCTTSKHSLSTKNQA